MDLAPLESHQFGRYETLFRIAGGGMAEVYAARQLGEGGFQKVVALKRMRPELAEDARFVAMFLDEGRMAANIQSPNVVSTLDLGRAEDNSLYLVMELVTGVSLQTLLQETNLRQEQIPIPMGVDIISQAANGLHAAHEARSPTGEPLEIVHRDCSPHNILVDTHGIVKITDFGIAKAMQRQTRSQAGEMKGKLSYLSPEQARGRPVDRRCDTFILGIVAWEVLAQRRLFDSDNAVEALHKVVTMPIPDLHTVNPSVSPEIAKAVARALERDPDLRYITTAAFGDALLDALGSRPPPRSALGAFVRRCGGETLQDVETGIRTAMGKKLSEPPPRIPSYPVPLVNSPQLGAVTRPPQTDGVRAEPSGTAPIPLQLRGKALPSSHPALATPAIQNDHTPFLGSMQITPGSMDENAATLRSVDPEVVEKLRSQPPPPGLSTRTLPLGGDVSAVVDAPSFSGGESVKGAAAFPNTRLSPTVPKPGPRPLSMPDVEALDWERPPSARRSSGGRTFLVLFLLVVVAGSAAAGAWYARQPQVDDDSDGAEIATPGDEGLDEPPPLAGEPVEVPETGEASDVDDPEAVQPEEVEPVRIAEPTPRIRHPQTPTPHPVPPARTRFPPRRPPTGNQPRPSQIRDRTHAPRGDRDVALDEIPWD